MNGHINYLLLPIDTELRKFLDRQTKGSGGYQSFIESLQKQVVSLGGAGYLQLTPGDISKIKRYRDNYGKGGFQQLLELIDFDNAETDKASF